jgi:hypothetical protein
LPNHGREDRKTGKKTMGMHSELIGL